ncbi:MAG: hypothetical protein PHG25_03745 [Candidatus Pacebacteria bacterium]|nr:hypothetical protein [Candidatus Paceibacterota bacterium]
MEGFNEIPPIETESKVEQMPSREMMKLKGVIDEVQKACEAVTYTLKQRTDERLVDFMDDTGIDSFSSLVSQGKTLDVYADADFEQTTKLLDETSGVLSSIEMRFAGGDIRDDVDSLKSFAWSLKDISDKAADAEFGAKQIDSDGARKAAESAQRLSQIAMEKAEYVASKAEALERYGG